MKNMPIPIHLGLSQGPTTRALYDGAVNASGIELQLQYQFGTGFDNTGARHRAIITGNLDGGELSLSSFIYARLRGIRLKALPVFPSYRFCHRFMRCSVKSDLKGPKELPGRKATIHRYNSTTPVWMKGILQDEYGVKLESVEWHVAEPEIGEETLQRPPATIRIILIPLPHTREHAIELVEEGKIDAALEPYKALEKNPRLRRLIPNFREVEAKYFRRTGILHLNHVVVLREDIVDNNPWIPERLLGAFRQAQNLTARYENEEENAEEKWKKEIMGERFDYSLKSGSARRSLELLMEYQVQQGIIKRAARLEELFFPQVMTT